MSSLILQRYVASKVIIGIGLTLSVIMVMIFLVDFVELSRDLGDRPNVAALQIAGLSLMRIPSLAENTLPFVFLFGAMWGMYQLNRRSELVVIRAAGMSAWRFVAPGVVIALASGVFAVTILSPAASRLMVEFERQRAMLESADQRPQALETVVVERALWRKEERQDGQIFIEARTVDPEARTIENASFYIYELDPDGAPEFARYYEVERAHLRAGFWQLDGVMEFQPDQEGVPHETLALPTDLDPTALAQTGGGPQTMTIWRLPEQIQTLRNNGFSSIAFELRLHQLLAMPLTLAAMTLVASAACLRLSRRGGAFQLAGLAALVGFALYFGDQMLGAFGATRLLPLPLAAWTAPLFTCFAALFVISALEDP